MCGRDDATEQTDKLTLFGLTRQEAAIYRFLCTEHMPQTGYEIAKQTGISRSNVYAAVSALTEKGAAYMLEGSPARYCAVAPRDFCAGYIRRLSDVAEEIERELPAAPPQTDGYITVSGRRRIVETARRMLGTVKGRVYIAADGDFINDIRNELASLLSQHIKVVLITPAAESCPDGATVLTADCGRGQLRMIADGACVLTGDVSRDDTPCSCLLSSKAHLVNLVKESLKHQIALIQFGENNTY